MRAVWFGGCNEVQPSVIDTTPSFASVVATFQASWNNTLNTRQNIIGEAVTIKRLVVFSDTAPGGSTSWTYAIDDDGSASAASVVLSGANTSVDSGEISVAIAQNSMIAMRATASVTDPATSAAVYWYVEYETAGNYFLMLGGTNTTASATVTEFNSCCGVSASTQATTYGGRAQLAPAGGTLTRVTAATPDGLPGASNSYDVSLRLNDSSDNLTASITNSALFATATGSVALAAGDRICMKSVPVSSPTVRRVTTSLTIEPTTVGQTWVGFGGHNLAADNTTRYEQHLGLGGNGMNSSETGEYLKLPAYPISKLYWRLETAPGSGKTRTLTIMDNSSATTLTSTISDTATTGNDTTHEPTLTGGGAPSSFRSGATGTPAASIFAAGFVITISTAQEFTLGLITETDTPNALSGAQTATLGAVAETGTVNAPLAGNPIYLGKTTDGTVDGSSSNPRVIVSPATASGAGTAYEARARIWIDGGSGPTATRFGLYADSAGAPGALLGTSDIVNITNTSEAEIVWRFPRTARPAIANGVTYWIGPAWEEPGTPLIRHSKDATGTSRHFQTVTWSTLPDPFGTPVSSLTGVIDAYVVSVASAVSVTLGLITETGTLNAIDADQVATLGLITETGTLNAVDADQVATLGLVTGTGTLNAVDADQVATLGAVAETDTVNALRSEYTLGAVAETGTLNTVDADLVKTLGLVTETGTLNAIDADQVKTLGLVTGTATLFGLTVTTHGWGLSPWGTGDLGWGEPSATEEEYTLGAITETGSLNAIDADQVATLGAVAETGTLNTINADQVATLGAVAETGALNAVDADLVATLGAVAETDTLNALSGAQTATLGAVAETGTLNAINADLVATLGLITETATLFNLVIEGASSEVYELGLITETGVLFALDADQVATLGLITETGTLNAVDADLVATLGAITEIGTLNALGAAQTVTLGVITGTGTLFAVDADLVATLGLITETATLYPLSVGGPGIFTLGLITEQATVYALRLATGVLFVPTHRPITVVIPPTTVRLDVTPAASLLPTPESIKVDITPEAVVLDLDGVALVMGRI